MTFTSENNTRFKTMGLKLCALAGVGMFAVTGLSACSDDSEHTDSNNSASSKKASDFGGDMTIDDAYAVYDTANKEGDTDQWCMIQTLSMVLEDYDNSNIHYLVEGAKHIDSDLVADTAREGCAHAILVADKSNQESGEAYMSMKYTLMNKDANNIDYVKKNAKEDYPNADIDLAFDELHNDKDKVLDDLDENVFNKAADLYKMNITPALVEEALRTDNKDDEGNEVAPGFRLFYLSADQYRKSLEEAGVDMSDFAAYVIANEIDEDLSAAIDSEKSGHHPFDVDVHETYYLEQPPAEWIDRLVDEFKFTESEARSGADYALKYASTREGRQPHILVPYLFSKYVEGPDHKPVTYTNANNGQKFDFTEDIYNKAETVGDLEQWEQGYLPAGVTMREAKKYSDEQIDKWQMDGTPLE